MFVQRNRASTLHIFPPPKRFRALIWQNPAPTPSLPANGAVHSRKREWVIQSAIDECVGVIAVVIRMIQPPKLQSIHKLLSSTTGHNLLKQSLMRLQRFIQPLQLPHFDHRDYLPDFVERSGQPLPREPPVALAGDDQKRPRALRVVSVFQPRQRAVDAARNLHLKAVAQSRRRSRVAPDNVEMLELRLGVFAQHQPDLDQHRLGLLVRERFFFAIDGGGGRVERHRFVLDAPQSSRGDLPVILLAPQFSLLFELTPGALHGARPAAAATLGAILQILWGELREVARQPLVKVAQLIAASGGFEFLKDWKFES